MTPLMFVRKHAGQSIGEVARALAVTPTHISKVERAKGRCSPELAEKLVKHFGSNQITEEQILYPDRYMANQAA